MIQLMLNLEYDDTLDEHMDKESLDKHYKINIDCVREIEKSLKGNVKYRNLLHPKRHVFTQKNMTFIAKSHNDSI